MQSSLEVSPTKFSGTYTQAYLNMTAFGTVTEGVRSGSLITVLTSQAKPSQAKTSYQYSSAVLACGDMLGWARVCHPQPCPFFDLGTR